MKNKPGYLLICILLLALQACTENKTQTDTPSVDTTTSASVRLWNRIPELSLPQQWDSVPANGIPADSSLTAQLELKPDTIGPNPEWKIIGKLTTASWTGLVYSYLDTDVSELHLATYTPADSLLSDIVLMNDQIIGILTTGTFSANISPAFAIQTSERLRSAASETDSTIISDEQTDKTYQIEANGVIKNMTNTTTNHVAASATHPEETEEGAEYHEFRYESPAHTERFVFTILGKEQEKHYYFENSQAEQRHLAFTGVSESNPNLYVFKLDGSKVTALWQNYTREEGISIPKTIVFTLSNGKKQTFKLKK